MWNLFQEVEYDSLKRFRSTIRQDIETGIGIAVRIGMT